MRIINLDWRNIVYADQQSIGVNGFSVISLLAMTLALYIFFAALNIDQQFGQIHFWVFLLFVASFLFLQVFSFASGQRKILFVGSGVPDFRAVLFSLFFCFDRLVREPRVRINGNFPLN